MLKLTYRKWNLIKFLLLKLKITVIHAVDSLKQQQKSLFCL